MGMGRDYGGSPMVDVRTNVVTGASGYIGKYITRRLLAIGESVKTLTGHPNRPTEFGDRVKVCSYSFDKPGQLVASLRSAVTLYNTYWIRFASGDLTFDKAVENSRMLITAAQAAGVRRVVHISIANPSEDSSLPYYRGKALVERAITDSGLTYAILRPTVVFGEEGILINNIAWLLRHMPVFGVPGSGDYRLQPIYVDDLAEMAVNLGHREENVVVDAVGPETFTFNELLRLIAGTVRSRARIIHVSPKLALGVSKLLGAVLGDVILTPEEVEGLVANLLVSNYVPAGHTNLSEWLAEHADRIGIRYMSEVKRHYRR